jgi:hypothetical protein
MGVHACRAAIAVDECIFFGWQLIMHYMFDLGNIKSAGGQVGGD